MTIIHSSEQTTIYRGDCLIESDKIADGSVDLILSDLPYGVVRDIGDGENISHGMQGKTCWDFVIETERIYEIANRILRKNGKMVLFSQDPFSTELKNKALPSIPFSYPMIWEKDHFANSLIAKKAPVAFFEDVLVFSKNNHKYDFDGSHPLRGYFLDEKEEAGLTNASIRNILGNEMGGHYFTGGVQFCLPTADNYAKLQSTGYFNREYADLKKIDTSYRDGLLREMNEKFPSTFNLWEGGRYKSNILRYKKDYSGYHPTQKPVALLKDLIKTFSNAGDLVVDLTMGSGSTGVAARDTSRGFIGIEIDANYFEIAERRIVGRARVEIEALGDGEQMRLF